MSRRASEFFSGKQDPVYHSSYAQYPLAETHGQHVYPLAGTSMHSMPVVELRVPMCCEKCVEKVKEEVEELEGVRSVVCDQYNQRVTVTGLVDPARLLKKVKRVKKKSEFFSMGSYIDHASHTRAPGVVSTQYTGRELVRSNSFGRTHGGGLTRSNSFGRQLGRQPSFGKHVVVDSRARDYERENYGVRRMPSFKKHRYHDAEYLSMDNRYTPAYGETRYVSHHSSRPAFQSQVSFSNIPVTNPYYMKHIDSEY